jgi:hypothetical protein
VAIWYIFPRFGILYQEKSGNPGFESALTMPGIFDRKKVIYNPLPVKDLSYNH